MTPAETLDGSTAITLQYPKTAWLGGMIALAFIAPIAVAALIWSVAILIAGGDPAFVVILVLLGAFMASLCLYLGHDALGKLRWSIRIGERTITLHLPAHRSITHKPKGLRDDIGRDEIDGIEARLEGYTSFGLANLQRCFAIRLRDGRRIILAEDRALRTGLAKPVVSTLVRRLADSLSLEIEEKPMVRGSGGILGVWLVRAPDWNAEPLNEEAARRMLKRVDLTGKIVAFAPILVIALSLIGLLI